MNDSRLVLISLLLGIIGGIAGGAGYLAVTSPSGQQGWNQVEECEALAREHARVKNDGLEHKFEEAYAYCLQAHFQPAR